MHKFLNRLSFSRRILILVAVPLSALSLFSIISIFDHVTETRKTSREIASVHELTELGTVIAGAIHEWQKERGRSAGFLGAAGQKFQQEIRQQHALTDEAMRRLEKAIAANNFALQPPEFHSALRKSVETMGNIKSWREDVLKLQVQGGQAVSRYTGLITNFLSVIDTSASLTENAKISLLLVSYSNFLKAKENMGVERAVLSNTFSADRFKSDFFQRYCTVLAKQTSYLNSFEAYARPEHIQAYRDIVQGASVEQVAAWEKLAFEKAETGGFGVKPEDWFSKITDKINLMKEVEDLIAVSVQKSSQEVVAASNAQFYTITALASFTLIFSILLSYVLARSTNRSLRETVFSLTTGVDEVAQASGEVSQASMAMASAASEQSSSLSHTTLVLNGITDITRTNGDLAYNANNITAEARKMVDSSLTEMRSLQNAMDEICTSSDEISAIIKTIDEIAFQTNILALNAAVEAARAGEAGSGFAVVADEVRNLAQRSARAAADTTRKIEDSVQRAQNGTKISTSVGQVLQAIVEKVRDVDNVVSQIDTASKQQLESILEIRNAVQTQEEVVTSASTSTQQTASAAEELYSQAAEMQRAIRHLAEQAGVSEGELPQIKQSPKIHSFESARHDNEIFASDPVAWN